MRYLLIGLAVMLLSAGCVGYGGHLIDSLDTPNGKLEPGISLDYALKIMGPPDSVSRYPAFVYADHVNWLWPVAGTSEYAWIREKATYVAYIHTNKVTRVAELDF